MEQKKQQGQFYNPNYKNDQARCHEFLTQFIDPNVAEHPTHGQMKYMIQLQEVANNQRKKLDILLEDIKTHFQKENEKEFVHDIQKNTMKYLKIFSLAADAAMPGHEKNEEEEEDDGEENIQIINRERRMNLRQNQNIDNLVQNLNNRDNQKLPNLLTRKFQLQIIKGPGEKKQLTPIRKLLGDRIGQLVQIKGIVVRIFEVKPMIQVASYACEQCGCENYQTVPNKNFIPIQECQSNVCKTNNLKGKLSLNMSASLFTSFQEIIIQETGDQIPEGSIPRSFNLICKGENVRQCSAGDIVTVQGVFLPETAESFRGNHNLMMNTYLEAFEIIRDKKKYVDQTLTEQRKYELQQAKNSCSNFQEFYDNLSQSICSEIYGMEDVKKALLLLMVGGLTNTQKDGVKIRGDINIALVGDPGIAKSQLLKQIAFLSPRGVYTTGKGSSGVGLTASVLKDPVTNEVSLEAGALVLADMGVCCIDEFDKMNEYDRTSIHEVMEQQTVSIAKAGITTQLNARTSILAAANPQFGRYNRNITAHENINLPAALLSRFDLIFILIDEARQEQDLKLAMHIGRVHMHQKAKTTYSQYDKDFIRDFVGYAKSNERVTLNSSIHDYITKYYVYQRQNQTSGKEGSSYVTPRTLLGIIRLAQAYARIRQIGMEEIVVEEEDVREAIRLIEVCQEKIRSKQDRNNDQPDQDNTAKIFNIIKTACMYMVNQNYTTKYSNIETKAFSKGYKGDQIQDTIRHYENLNIIQYNREDQTVTLIDPESKK